MFFFGLQYAVDASSADILPAINSWNELTTKDRAVAFMHLRQAGPAYIKYLNTLLVTLFKAMKTLLSVMKTGPSAFFAPVSACMEFECMGGYDEDFVKLVSLQEKYLRRHQERGFIIGVMMMLFVHPEEHDIYRKEGAREKVISEYIHVHCLNHETSHL
jgi:hypothetical protein